MSTMALTIEDTFADVVRGDVELDLDDVALVRWCAERHVYNERRKYQRAQSRDVERTTKIRQRADARLRERVRAVSTEWKATLYAGWSDEILDSYFSIGTNETVRYADATAEQHEARAVMLENMAAGDLHTAAIHRRAIDDIRINRVDTLAQAVALVVGA